jgi:opacity protein-like surface antigen
MQGNAPCVLVLSCSVKHNWVADVTGRVGVVAFDRALIYAKGGVACTDAHYTIGNSITVGAPVNTTLAANLSANGTLTWSAPLTVDILQVWN